MAFEFDGDAALLGANTTELSKKLRTILQYELRISPPFEPWMLDVSFTPAVPCLQKGPTCGFVAIQIAGAVTESSTIGIDGEKSLDVMLDCARKLGMTRHGEMFSTQNLLQIFRIMYGGRTAEVRYLQSGLNRTAPEFGNFMDTLANFASSDGIVIIPYDKGADHRPAMRKGHSAHWSVIVGVIRIAEKVSAVDSKVGPKEHIYVICRHGGSAHLALWSLSDLLESNLNLMECGKLERDGVPFAIPDPSDLAELRGSMIFVHHSRPRYKFVGDAAVLENGDLDLQVQSVGPAI